MSRRVVAQVAYHQDCTLALLLQPAVFSSKQHSLSLAVTPCRLRNAKSRSLPPSIARLITLLCKLLVACVIICGPILGISAVGVMYAKPGDRNLMYHGMMIRKASSAVSAINLWSAVDGPSQLIATTLLCTEICSYMHAAHRSILHPGICCSCS